MAASPRSSGTQGTWNGIVTVNGSADVRQVERKLREVFPGKTIEVRRNDNHKGWT